MIQRVQSIFLFLAAACGFGTLALPFATTPQGIQASGLFSDAAFASNDHAGIMALFAIAGLLALVGIFLYQNRPLQLKICTGALIANILGIVLTVLIFWQDSANLAAAAVNDGFGAYLPVLYAVLGFLALRYIRKDEALVRSMDRLR